MSKMAGAVRTYLEAAENAREAIRPVSDALFAQIGAEPSTSRRSALIQLRRSLFNSRIPTEQEVLAISTLPEEAKSIVTQAVSALGLLNRARVELTSEFCEAPATAGKAIRRALQDPRFIDGVLLSSSSLFRSRDRYMRAHPEARGSRLSQIERGFLRYLTRACMKATPFSSFCTVVAGTISDMKEAASSSQIGGLVPRGSIAHRVSLIRLNKAIYGTLWAHLRQREAIRQQLTVELSPTLRREHDQFQFIAGGEQQEVLQRMEATESLVRIISLVRSRSAMSLAELTNAIASDEAVDATRDEVRRFLDALLNIGILQFRGVVAPQEVEWAAPLFNLLALIDDDHARIIAGLLENVMGAVARYDAATSNERSDIMQEMKVSFEDAWGQLALPTRTLPRLILYEDCTAPLAFELVRSAPLNDLLAKIGAFNERRLPVAYPRSEMATMRHYFERKYGTTAQPVPFLTFYEDYYRDHYREHQIKERRIRSGDSGADIDRYDVHNPFGLSAIRAIQSHSDSWGAAIIRAWMRDPTAEEIHILPSEVPADTVSPLDPSVPRSTSLFCQLVVPDGHDATPRMLINNGVMYLGFGKYFSRFLDLLPPPAHRALYERNERLSDHLLAEIDADGNFNANLHPPLLPWRIASPGAECESGDRTLRFEDLLVEANDSDPLALSIRHRLSRRRVIPMDLGFQNPRMRPPILRLLSIFAPLATHSIPLPSRLPQASPAEGTTATITYRPRIVYDRVIVLSRRRWTIPATLFPSRMPAESSLDYFIRVNEWRSSLAIPEQTFVHLAVRQHALHKPQENDAMRQGLPVVGIDKPSKEPESAALNPTDSADDVVSAMPRSAPRGHDVHKPQYIDFTRPILVDLFGRLPVGFSDFHAVIEERYPPAQSLPIIDGNRHATEMVMQFDWPSS